MFRYFKLKKLKEKHRRRQTIRQLDHIEEKIEKIIDESEGRDKLYYINQFGSMRMRRTCIGL